MTTQRACGIVDSETAVPRGLRMALVMQFAFPGTTGSPLLAMDLCRGFARRAGDVYVVRYCGKFGRPRLRRWESVDVYDVPLWAWPALVPWLFLSRRTQVVHAHGDVGGVLGWLSARLTGRPVYLEIHSLNPGAASLNRCLNVLMRLAYALLPWHDGVVVLSNTIGDALVETVGGRLNHLVAYPPAPLLTLPPVQRRERPRILYLGNFYVWQGVDMLLEALRLLDSWDSGFSVRLIGGSREELREVNGDQPLPSQIQDVRRVPPEEVVAELETADILVIPRPDTPINRTTARKLGEYLASGRHVVVTDVGDHRLLLGSSDCAIVVAPNPEAIAKGLHGAILRVRSERPTAEDGPAIAARYFGPAATIHARLRFFAESVN